jgi:hypothetical protein
MEQTTREQERGSTAARNRDEATQRGSAAARLVSMALLSTRSQQILFADACCLLLLCAPRFAIEGRLSGESSREWVRRPVSRRRALPRRCRRRPWRRRHRLERDPRPTDRQTDRHTHTHKHGYADTERRRHASQPHAACRGNSAPPPHASLPHVSPPPLPAACCSEHGGEREREFLRGRGARRTARVRASTSFAAARHAPPVPLVFMKRSARVCALCVCSCACRVRVCARARSVCACVCRSRRSRLRMR